MIRKCVCLLFAAVVSLSFGSSKADVLMTVSPEELTFVILDGAGVKNELAVLVDGIVIYSVGHPDNEGFYPLHHDSKRVTSALGYRYSTLLGFLKKYESVKAEAIAADRTVNIDVDKGPENLLK